MNPRVTTKAFSESGYIRELKALQKLDCRYGVNKMIVEETVKKLVKGHLNNLMEEEENEVG